MFTEKTSARKHYLRLRADISDREQKEKALSQLLLSYLMQREFSSVMLYLAIGSEAETKDVIDCLVNRGVSVWLPHTTKEGRIIPAPFVGWNDLTDGPFRTRQPSVDEKIPFHCDAVVVPGVSFDLYGNRLGYGKGCYDAFLDGFSGEKIGLCFSQQIGIFPTQTHDKTMDVLVTENGVVCVKRG